MEVGGSLEVEFVSAPQKLTFAALSAYAYRRAVASAVILPEPEEILSSLQGPTKRRQSSVSEGATKRPRLSHGTGHDREDAPASPPLTTPDRTSERRKSGQMEERKRGQRLFGALLGTLSQSSSSTAQKRRIDIERKQQAKLKLQAEEFDEKKKERLEALMAIRRREQKKYDKQSMQIRHSNHLAAAQFLQTKAEPKLYYKPWELSPGDEAKIKAQIEQAQEFINEETLQFETDSTVNDEAQLSDTIDELVKSPEVKTEVSETVGHATNLAEPSEPATHGDTNHIPSLDSNASKSHEEPVEALKENGDDGGEIVLEGEEDTVIY
ncbi:hypothetical protein MMC12_004277 [Toensbergia leucococca]|nr:hypothetical protein [Toensbergia leucococca]